MQVGGVTAKGVTMTPIAVRPEDGEAGEPRFRAIAGDRQSIGRTMGEALDALVAGWADDVQETAVLIQRFHPDRYFTEVQHQRMRELLDRRGTLSADERAELETLIDAELSATVARTDCLAGPQQP
jgi:hypothetical protein